MPSELLVNPKLNWLKEDKLRPYVYVRPENRIADPGKRFAIDWFTSEPLFKNPLCMDEVDFADQILRLESRAFAATNMPMPRWVFYDCAIMPGFVAGYAMHRSAASQEILEVLQPKDDTEWLPISLFIIIPTMAPKEWVAHNLCSINSLITPPSQVYGLGFLTKAFGLWYANVEMLCGITQWASPAVRLHTHYGDFEVLTAYTPIHSFARTLTYRMVTDSKEWKRFFSREQAPDFDLKYEYAGFEVDPKSDESLISFQRKLESRGARYYLNAAQLRAEKLDAVLKVYQRKNKKEQ
jgi:hypothetical protein